MPNKDGLASFRLGCLPEPFPSAAHHLIYCQFRQYFEAMADSKLTSRQKEVLSFIEERQKNAAFAPTLEETVKPFGFKSPNSVRHHLRLIEKTGLLHRVQGRSRALVVAKPRRRTHMGSVRVPLLGRIAAGIAMLAAENADTQLEFPAKLFRGSQLFALRVQGASMEGAGILSGDVAIFDKSSEVKDGAIAAVLIGEEATLKRTCRPSGKLMLKADNPAVYAIEIAKSDCNEVRVWAD